MMNQDLRDALVAVQEAAWQSQAAFPGDRGHMWASGVDARLKTAVARVVKEHFQRLPLELQGAVEVLETIGEDQSFAAMPTLPRYVFEKALRVLTSFLEGKGSNFIGVVPASSGTSLILNEQRDSGQARLEQRQQTGERGPMDGKFPFYARGGDTELPQIRLSQQELAALQGDGWTFRPLSSEPANYGRDTRPSVLHPPGVMLPPGVLGYITPTEDQPHQPGQYGRESAANPNDVLANLRPMIGTSR